MQNTGYRRNVSGTRIEGHVPRVGHFRRPHEQSTGYIRPSDELRRSSQPSNQI